MKWQKIALLQKHIPCKKILSVMGLVHFQGSTNASAYAVTADEADITDWENCDVRNVEDLDGHERGPSIVDLKQDLFKLDQHGPRAKPRVRDNTAQTDPVHDEAFDWDLSDKTDIETQTVPPSRTNSINDSAPDGNLLLQDAIVQTDQRLVFLLRRSAPARPRAAHARYRLHDAWCQTYTEVQEIGVQVTPSEFDSEDDAGRNHGSPMFHKRSRSSRFDQERPRAPSKNIIQAEVQVHPRPKTERYQRINIGGFFPDQSLATQSMLSDSFDARHVDEDEISRAVSNSNFSILSQSDAGFQVNMAMDAAIPVADVANTRDVSSPVGLPLQRSVEVDLKREEELRRVNSTKSKKSLKVEKVAVDKVDVAIQTENDIITDESRAFKAVPPKTRKFEVISEEDTDVFEELDAMVVQESEKRYKSLKKIVKRLISNIPWSEQTKGKEELYIVRAFFRWVTENIRYTN